LVKKIVFRKRPINPAKLKEELKLPFSISKITISGDSHIEIETDEDVSDAQIEKATEAITKRVKDGLWETTKE
jgi:hypothetical protein